MKANIEINTPDNRTFLNFWNWHNGDDVVCELRDNKLILISYDGNGDELPDKEITFIEFIEMVKTRMNEIKSATNKTQ